MENNNQNNSLLDEIIASSKQAVNNQIPTNTTETPNPNSNTPPPNPEKKPRDPMSTSTIFKLIGSLILVILIFLGSFLTYVVLNPEQATFFVNVFSVRPDDIAQILRFLINGSFWFITFTLSVLFIITLFRAIWTKKELKRRKLISTILAVFSGIILFTTISIWAFLYDKIGKTNFTNTSGNILVYDNDLYNHDETRSFSRYTDFSNLIGPITLRYDISANAEYVERRTGMRVIGAQIDFNGADCGDSSWRNGRDKIDIPNPSSSEGIICTFSEVKKYSIKWKYELENIYTKEISTQEIVFDDVRINGVIKIEDDKSNKDDKKIFIADAGSVRRLGIPRWKKLIYVDGKISEEGNEIKENIFSTTKEDKPTIVGLRVYNSTIEGFDRVFFIQKESSMESEWEIEITQNTANPQEYFFTLTGLTINPDNILNITWKNDSTTMCRNRGDSCSYQFSNYGEWKIVAEVTLVGNKTLTFTQNFKLEAPLALARRLKITNRRGKLLNTEDTYDNQQKAFILNSIVPPETITLDARDIVPSNQWYVLDSVKWTINDGKNTKTENDEKIEVTISHTARYRIQGEYTFVKTIRTGNKDDYKIAQDNIILDLERKNLTPILKITKDSDYVPAKITVDASQSRAEYSEIIKFVFDFGEGRPETIGDAIQTYQYSTAGEKIITLTIIDSNNERATIKEAVVLKDTPKTLNFSTSLSPGVIGGLVDFTATNTTGQIEDYLWNFGDNTPIEHGYSVSHAFRKAWEYTVTLTVKYIDGTERSTRQTFKVVTSLD